MNIAEVLNPLKPTKPCYRCGGTDFWWREKGWGNGEYVCSTCHPDPNK
jgi:hypothetical protein